MNKYAPHVYVIPEDDADRQIADGFVLHDQIKTRQIQVMQPAGGWGHVLKIFQEEYEASLRTNEHRYVVMLIDFDGNYTNRRAEFDAAVSDDVKPRVFVVGAKLNPEVLKKELQMGLEDIGKSLADDCYKNTMSVWGHEHLRHNDPDRLRLLQSVKPILFNP